MTVKSVDTGATTLLQADPGDNTHTPGHPSISADGRYVAYLKWDDSGHGPDHIVRRDMTTGNDVVVSVGTDGSNQLGDYPSISADGQRVAFTSAASNLVPGDTNAKTDAFVRDITAGTTTRVSVASSGQQANAAAADRPSLSADGMKVAFASTASNLVSGDTNSVSDVFRHDLRVHSTLRLSSASDNTQSNDASSLPSINADGLVVAFRSSATNLTADPILYPGYNHIYVSQIHTKPTGNAVSIIGA